MTCERKPCETSTSFSRRPAVWSSSTVSSCRAAASMTAPATSAKYGLPSSGTASVMIPVRPLRRWRAVRLGR